MTRNTFALPHWSLFGNTFIWEEYAVKKVLCAYGSFVNYRPLWYFASNVSCWLEIWNTFLLPVTIFSNSLKFNLENILSNCFVSWLLTDFGHLSIYALRYQSDRNLSYFPNRLQNEMYPKRRYANSFDNITYRVYTITFNHNPDFWDIYLACYNQRSARYCCIFDALSTSQK